MSGMNNDLMTNLPSSSTQSIKDGTLTERSPLLSANMVSEKVNISQQVLVSQSDFRSTKKTSQYIAAFIATVGGLIAGTCLAWTAPVEVSMLKGGFRNLTVTSDDFGWISSFMPFGAIAGAIVTALFVDLVGRKGLILILTVPCVIGWASMAFSVSVLMMCLGRFLTGVATGCYCILAPLYTAEIAEKEIRGTLGTYFQLQITIGILFVYVVGCIADVFTLTVICGLFPVIYLFLMLMVPETPYFYIMKRNIDAAQKSLVWFRGTQYDCTHEIVIMKRNVQDDENNKVPILQSFQTTAARRGLIVGLGVMFLQQFSGCNAVIFYVTSIFQDATNSITPSVASIIVGVIQFVATWVATLVVDRLGRRILLLLSIVLMTLFTFTLGLYFYLKYNVKLDVSGVSWLPILSVSAYIIIFSLGFGPIPWMLMAEIFPSKIKSTACSIACLFNWLCTFLVTKLFPIMRERFGPGISFWCFTVCSGIGILFVLFCVPETKGKTLLEVQELLSRGQVNEVKSQLSHNGTIEEGTKGSENKDNRP